MNVQNYYYYSNTASSLKTLKIYRFNYSSTLVHNFLDGWTECSYSVKLNSRTKFILFVFINTKNCIKIDVPINVKTQADAVATYHFYIYCIEFTFKLLVL